MRRIGLSFLQGFGMTCWVVCLVGVLVCGSDAWGKTDVKPDKEAALEAKNVAKICNDILKEYVAENVALTEEDVEAIREELKIADRYFVKFDSEQKAYYYLVKAYLNHYSAMPKKDPVLMAQKAYAADSENLDVSNSLLALSLYHGKYSVAQKLLAEFKGGKAVIAKAKKVKAASGSGGDPNMPGMGGGAGDPNNGDSFASGKGAVQPEEKKSRWSHARREKKSGNSLPRPMSPDMGMGMMDMEMGMGMGMGMGMDMGMGGPSSSSRSVVKRRPAGRTTLDIPHEYMPYESLGQPFQSLDVRNVNGSSYQFESGQGEVMCALLWTLPEGGGTSRSAPRRKNNRNVPSGQMAVQEIVVDLWGNVDQFRELYRFHRGSGKSQFVTVNLDEATAENSLEVEDVFMERAWPWVNFMAQDSGHATKWTLRGVYTQVMVIVDPEGTIRYMGPVGGFLPMMLLDAQLAKATVQEEVAPVVVERQEKEAVVVEAVVVETPEPVVKAEEPKGPVSSRQASQMLQLARVKKRVSVRGALNIYDDILSDFGQTQEADIARMQIKSICRRDSRMKKERLKAGKYTGFE